MHPQSPKLSSRGATIPSFSLGYPRPAVRLTCSGLQIPGLAAPSRVLTEATTGGQDRELLRSDRRGLNSEVPWALLTAQRPCVPLVCPSLPASLPRPLPTLRVYLFSAPFGRPSHSSPWEKASRGRLPESLEGQGWAGAAPPPLAAAIGLREVGGWDGGAVEDPEN